MDTIQLVAQFARAFNQEVRSTPGWPEGVDYAEFPKTVGHQGMALLGKAFHFNAQCAAELDRPGEALLLLRLQLIQEELGELAEAFAEGDLVGALDALCDLRYVVDGTVLALGLQGVFAEAFDAVHRSNMSKLDGAGRPVKDAAGRVVKSDRYEPPNLSQFIRRSAQRQQSSDAAE